MTLSIERRYPIIVGALSALAYCFYFKKVLPPESFDPLFPNTVNLSGIAIGFLATAKAILISVGEKHLIKYFKQAEVYRFVSIYVLRAIHASFVLAFVSAIAMMANKAVKPWWFVYCCTLWVFSLVTAVLAYYRIIHIFSQVLGSED